MNSKWLIPSLMVGAWLCFATPAMAQAHAVSPEVASRAQSLYDEAIALMDAHQYPDACSKLEEVTSLVPAGFGVHGALGQCYKALQRFGSAWDEFTLAEAVALQRGELTDAAAMAALAKEVESTAAKLTILVPQEAQDLAGLTISRNGKKQEKNLWNTPLPVNTGKHVILVEAPGRQTWSREVEIIADGAPVVVDVPLLPVLPQASRQPQPERDKLRVTNSPPITAAPALRHPQWGPQRIAVLTGASIAGIGAATAIVAGAIAARKAPEINERCPSKTCLTAEQTQEAREAQTLAYVANGGWLVSGVASAVTCAVVLSQYLMSKRAESAKPRVEVSMMRIDSSGAMFGVKGTF